MILKNSYGLTTILSEQSTRKRKSINIFTGSSLNRNSTKKEDSPKTKKARNKKILILDQRAEDELKDALARELSYSNHERERTFYQETPNRVFFKEEDEITEFKFIEEEEEEEEEDTKSVTKTKKLRSMSPRTKQKIRKKVIAFSQAYKKLNFLTLTFINQVEDKQAISMLAKFLDNCTKQMKDFQYVWVAERQTKNAVFENNIHFHLITNKYFKISKYWEYWLKLQEKSGIEAREANFKASSAFDIKSLNAKNIKAIGQYITKYVTKNKDQFDCQVWNCSKKISMLYTDFYSGYEFIENAEKVLEYELEPIPAEYCTIYPIPLNRKTLPLYQKLNEKNSKLILCNK
jgi:hypothetical protein